MNVYASADFHGQLFDIPADADLALLAGDVCYEPYDEPWTRLHEFDAFYR